VNQPKPKGGKRIGAGAKKGVRLAPATRERIRGAMLINRLEKIANGEVVAEPHMVTAALGLLRFQLPQLTAVDLDAKVDGQLTVNVVQYQEKK